MRIVFLGQPASVEATMLSIHSVRVHTVRVILTEEEIEPVMLVTTTSFKSLDLEVAM